MKSRNGVSERMVMPELKAGLLCAGVVIVANSWQALRQLVDAQIIRFERLIKAARIRAV